MKITLTIVSLLLSSLVLAQTALDEGGLPAGAWEGVVFTNPGELRAVVTVSLRRGDQVIEQVPLELEPGQTRSIRMDRLFIASAGGAAISFRSSQRIQVFGYRGEELTPAATAGKRRAVRSPGNAPVLVPHTITLTPSKDNTLYQDTSGSISNGSGVHIFAGATNSRAIRRALLAFNVASQIPPGSQVTRVVLTLRISASISAPQAITLHRVTKDWGEGQSDAGFSRDGGGTAAQPGDATWIHTFSPNQRWTNAGGDFDAAADATASPTGIQVSWESPGMIARVQQWLDQPSTNFGWLLKGNESSPSAKRFDSRELAPSTTLPALLIEYNGRQ